VAVAERQFETEIQKLFEDTDAVIAWDYDGVLTDLSWYENLLERFVPKIIPEVQRFYQSPTAPLANYREKTSHHKLASRTLDDRAIGQLIRSYSFVQLLDPKPSPLVVKNIVLTERPHSFQELFFDQMTAKLSEFRTNSLVNGDITLEKIIQGYFDNPPGEDFTTVKPNAALAAQEMGVGFYLLEDKLWTANSVLDQAPEAVVYLITRNPATYKSHRKNLIPIPDVTHFVSDVSRRILEY
jgi:hypothetical protein